MDNKKILAAVGVGAAVTVGAALYMRSDDVAARNAARVAQQAVLLEPEGPGESAVVRSREAENGLIARFDPAVTTLYDAFQRGVRISGNARCYGWRRINGGPYSWATYREVEQTALDVGSALRYLDVKRGDNVGIYAVNRVEWGYVMQACSAFTFPIVSLYDTLGHESVQYILDKCNVEVVFVTAATVDRVVEELPHLPKLRYLVNFDMEDGDDKAYDQVTCMSFSRLLKLGHARRLAADPPAPEDLASIQFTSGTTGLPKGVMMTHAQCVAELSGAIIGLDHSLTAADVHISYLPLAHSFERAVQFVLTSVGGSIGFFRGDVRKHLFEDIGELRPTLFCSVPRLFNRIYDAAMKKLHAVTGLRRTLFERAWAAKVAGLEQGHLTHWLWDRLVFGKIAGFLGGRVKVILSGSAPISPDVMQFLRICFSCTVLEGYGQTENMGGASLTRPFDLSCGHVGPPMVCNEMKLVDVPEMNYHAADKPLPRGEICIRGHNVMAGYYGDEEKTRAAIDENGWLHTGDIGCITETGCIKVIDRVKSLFKLSQGEYVAPEKVENTYVKSPYIMQAFVHGDSSRDSIVAVIIVDAENIREWAAQRNLPADPAELAQTDAVHELVAEEIARVAKEFRLNRLETARHFIVDHEEFTVANGILTPSFKLMRRGALAKYGDALNRLMESPE